MIDVIVPVFNRPEYTKVCLDALKDVDHGVPIRPIIADNGSRRKTKTIIKEWRDSYPDGPTRPEVIWLDRNEGFAGAINAAIAGYPPKDNVVIMHNDCIPFPGWAKELNEILELSDEDVAVVMPRTSYANEGTPCIREVRERFQTIKPGNKDRLEGSEIKSIIEQTFPEGVSQFLESISKVEPRATYSMEICSFCMMARPTFLTEQKFDADFWPRGWEDKWWFRRWEREGYIAQIATRSFVFHFGNISSDGPGFSFPDIMKVNEEKYRAKCLVQDKTGP